jgi:hypothetical protein
MEPAMPADSPAAQAREFPAGRPAARSLLGRSLAAAGALTLLAACGSSGSQAGGQPTATATAGASSSSAAPSASSSAATPPGMVAVTTHGALVVLNPATGAVARTLLSSGVTGDEVTVSASGQVYFAVKHGCTHNIESVPVGGGTPVVITAGTLPAISPDGSKLAFASEPSLTIGCMPSTPDLTPLFKVVVRTLSTGAETDFPMVPNGTQSSLPAPVSHLSWGPDSQHLAVSTSPIQDNEGWDLALVDTATAKYYLSGSGISYVPVTGSPSRQRSYLREGVYQPNGDLFVSRACCAGVPVQNTSRLMWEVTPGGTLVHQVAIGYPSLEHTSLDVSANGGWLLYLAGHGLYVSQGGATPRELTTGLIAAAWQ